MSVRHPEFCELVERLAEDDQLTQSDRQFLESYAAPADDREVEREVEDLLDRTTREAVQRLTGDAQAWSPRRAASALLASASRP